jgi:urea transport system substrate-binding protein
VIRSFVTSHPFETILGRLAIDHRTNHASLPAHVGRISLKDTFDIVMSHPPVVADPYLAHPQGQGAIRPGQDRHLRIVS